MDESKMCQLVAFYDGDIHNALANLSCLDGSLPVHLNNGHSVIFFALRGTTRKYWIRAKTPPLGYFS